jgi:hypothetical protein
MMAILPPCYESLFLHAGEGLQGGQEEDILINRDITYPKGTLADAVHSCGFLSIAYVHVLHGVVRIPTDATLVEDVSLLVDPATC